VTDRRASTSLRQALPAMAQGGAIASLFLIAAIAMAGMPPLSGFVGKLLIMDALRGNALVIWSVILTASFILILGFARAGSTLFWKAPATDIPPAHDPEYLAFAASFALVAALVLLTVFAGPITQWINTTAAALHDPAAYIAANALQALP
jgi:multicomponent K+:H+ antiporter subunit D